MRNATRWAFVGVGGLLLAGCGGGGTAPASAPTVVQGKVLSVNGAPSTVAGIDVTVECVNDGTSVPTAADGTFSLDVPAGVPLRVRFRQNDLGTPVAGVLPGGCTETGDGTHDRGDLDVDVVEIEPLEDGEVCGLEVELADGRVVEVGVEHPHHDGPRFHGEGILVPVRPGAEHPALGEVEVVVDGDCATLEVEAVRLAPGATYEVLLFAPDLAQEVLGTLTADDDGAAHLSMEGCAGDPLPFGVAALSDLAGYGVLVVDADGLPVLVGQVPGHGHEWGEPGHVPGHPGDHPDAPPHGGGGHDGGGVLPLPHPTDPGALPPGLGDDLPGDLPDLDDLDDLDDLLDFFDDLLGEHPLGGGLPGNAP